MTKQRDFYHAGSCAIDRAVTLLRTVDEATDALTGLRLALAASREINQAFSAILGATQANLADHIMFEWDLIPRAHAAREICITILEDLEVACGN